MKHLNSFQLWARDWARAYGFDVQPAGNWVTLHEDGREPIECMSVAGVQRACDQHKRERARQSREVLQMRKQR